MFASPVENRKVEIIVLWNRFLFKKALGSKAADRKCKMWSNERKIDEIPFKSPLSRTQAYVRFARDSFPDGGLSSNKTLNSKKQKTPNEILRTSS